MTECKSKIENSIDNKAFLHQVYGFIFKSEENIFKNIKSIQIKKPTKLLSSWPTAVSWEPDHDSLHDKWVYNLSSKPVTTVEKSLLQKGPTFGVFPSSTPILHYITATKHISDSLGVNNLFGKTACTEYYVKVKDVLSKSVVKVKPMHPNIT